MVEKTGHKTVVLNRRKDWIAEERRRELGTGVEDDEDREAADGERGPELPEMAREKTPAPAPVDVDEEEEDDLYNASPRRAPRPVDPVDAGQPEDDDLEALMMEADDDLQPKGDTAQGGSTAQGPPPPDDDFADEEAAMAEMGGLW